MVTPSPFGKGENMSLREKAKTLVQIIRENCVELYNLRCRDCIGQCEFENSESFAGKWIEVEDAEQAIAKLKQEYLANIMEEDRRQQLRIQELNKEYEELKQKLQQLLNEFPDINDEKYRFSGQEFITDTYPMFICDVFRWKQKFEELLKEEKNSKKKRLPCFGDANMSDACAQCPDNEECVEETLKRPAKPAFGKQVEKIFMKMIKEESK
jgi:hypothetical protein